MPTATNNDELLDPTEVAERLGEPRRAVVVAMREGRLPALWLGPRRPRVSRAVLDAFLRGEVVAETYFQGKAAL